MTSGIIVVVCLPCPSVFFTPLPPPESYTTLRGRLGVRERQARLQGLRERKRETKSCEGTTERENRGPGGPHDHREEGQQRVIVIKIFPRGVCPSNELTGLRVHPAVHGGPVPQSEWQGSMAGWASKRPGARLDCGSDCTGPSNTSSAWSMETQSSARITPSYQDWCFVSLEEKHLISPQIRNRHAWAPPFSDVFFSGHNWMEPSEADHLALNLAWRGLGFARLHVFDGHDLRSWNLDIFF